MKGLWLEKKEDLTGINFVGWIGKNLLPMSIVFMYHGSPQGKYFTICIMHYRTGTGRISYNALFRNSQARSVKSCEILTEHV